MKKLIFSIRKFLNNLSRKLYAVSLVINLEIYEYKTQMNKHNIFYRINALLHGYSSDLYKFLKLKGKDFYKHSISEYEYRYKINHINHEYGILMADKQMMYIFFNEYLQYFPKLLFYIQNNKFQNGDFEELLNVLKEKGKLILKSTRSYGGKGVHLLEFKNDKFYYDSNYIKENSLKELINSLIGNYIITEYVKQRQYADKINPTSTNSMRIMTLYDKDTDECWIGGVVHRFGTVESGFVDNLTSGGISAGVDIETGIIEQPLSNFIDLDFHPNTNEVIKGVKIPNWKFIKDKILEMSRYASRTPYLGWDVVVTNDGFKVLEVNECADIHLIQYHTPPLKDERNKRFFAKYNIKTK